MNEWSQRRSSRCVSEVKKEVSNGRMMAKGKSEVIIA